MKKLTKRKNKTAEEMPQMSFDGALRRILNAPPMHKKSKKQAPKKRDG